MRKVLFTTLSIVVLWLFYIAWSNSSKVSADTKLPESDSPNITFVELAEKDTMGNLIGIQPFMEVVDYTTENSFYNKLNSYLEIASEKGLLNKKSIVVFPEHIGTWLVAANEKEAVFGTDNSNEALQLVAISNIFKFGKAYLQSNADDKMKAALFLMKAEKTAAMYGGVFKKLARQYNVTIIGGSIFLPSPKVDDNEIKISGSKIYNASFVFYPDGSIAPQITKKQFPINEELIFCEHNVDANPQPYDTPLGALSVVICADSWYPRIYSNLESNGTEIIVIPSFSSPNNLWQTRWKGYNGSKMPTDVDSDDVGTITEGEAWLKYSMGGRAKSTSLTLGINVFLRGAIWDLGDDGHTIVYKNGEVFTAPFYDGPQITVVWK